MNKKHVIAAAAWLRIERQRLGWSVDALAEKVERIGYDLRWEGIIPDARDITNLEAEAHKSLPRWFKIVRYAIEIAAVPQEQMLAWLGERNPYWQLGETLRLTRPFLFEDEWRFIATLDRFEEGARRAIRAFVTDYAGRQCYHSKEEMATGLMSKLGIELVAIDDEERRLLEAIRNLSPSTRIQVQDAIMSGKPHFHRAVKSHRTDG